MKLAKIGGCAPSSRPSQPVTLIATDAARARGPPRAGDHRSTRPHERLNSSAAGPPTRAGATSPAATAPPTWSRCRAASSRSTRSPGSAPSGCGTSSTATRLRPRARRAHRQPGGAERAGRPAGDLPVRLAGRRRRQLGRPDLPGPEPVPGQLGAAGRAPDQQRAAAGRPDRGRRRRHARVAALARPDRRRRRGRLRRPAERVRADEGDDRGRRGRRALGGPALLGEEVRPPRRQGADPDRPAHPHPQRGPAGRRRLRRADAGHRAHRRRGGHPAHQRRRRARPAVRHRRPHRRGLLPGAATGSRPASRAAWPTRRTPTCSGWRPRRPTSRWPASSPRASRPSTPTSCSPTTARRRSTGGPSSTTPRSRSSRTSSGTWATSSSSSRWPASTPSTTRCSTSPRATPRPA